MNPNFPPFFYTKYYSQPNNLNVIPQNNNNNNFSEKQKRTSSARFPFTLNFQNFTSSNFEEPIIEILGIKLFSDDILILGLLFFLYRENVKDDALFLSLILLLLS